MSAKSEIYVSIGDMKKRLSELTNRVAFEGERIILTFRGRPKAVVVSLEDYDQLKQLQQEREEKLRALETVQAHRRAILERREGKPIDMDIVELIQEMREERTRAILEISDDRP